MININYNSLSKLLAIFALVLAISACKTDLDGLEEASFPINGDVFIDGFSAGLEYAAFGGSDVFGFDVVNDVTYEGDAAMRFAVPDVGDPAGSYVGGTYFVDGGRDLSSFDALTFWAKASKSATIDVIGFGNDLGDNEFVATISGGVRVNTNWKQYILPLPDPSVLTQEKGMFFYSEGPEDGDGYTFWIDEVKFETLGTLAQYESGIQNKQDDIVEATTGQNITISGLVQTVNLPSGVDQTVELAPAYFTFSSSNTSVATVNSEGVATVLDAGTAVITAKLGEVDAVGSLTIEGVGEPVLPPQSPVPTRSADSVISLYSNVYENELVNTWDTDWEFTTTETDFVNVDGDDMIRYRNLNFVGIEFTSPTIDISEMTHFHMNIWTPDPTNVPNEFKVLFRDFGPNNVFDEAGDDTFHELTFTSPTLVTGNWVTIDVPLSAFAGLTTKMNLAQMVLSGSLPNVFVDNVYFYIAPPAQGGDCTPLDPSMTSLPIDFENCEDFTGVFEAGDGVTGFPTSNPDMSGNTSTRVYQFNKVLGSAWYSGIFHIFPSNYDMTDNKVFKMKIWSPKPNLNVRFQIEKEGGGAVTYLKNATVSDMNTWTELSFDFSDQPFIDGFTSYDKIVIIPDDADNGPSDGSVYYIDDVQLTNGSGGGNDCPVPLDPALTTSFPIDFENCESLDGVFEAPASGTPIANPDIAGINTSTRVYEINKVNGAAWYSGAFHVFDGATFDMTDDQVFKMKVWSPKPNTNFRFQIEKEGGGAVTYQVDQTVVNMNTWTELTFDFSGFPFTDGTSGVYDKIVIFPDYIQDGPPADGSIFYIDDIEQTAGSGGNDCPVPLDPALTTSFPINFENCESLDGVFEAPASGAPIANPDIAGINTSTRVYEINKVNGAAWYSGAFHVFDGATFDMTDDQVFKMKVWSPKPNTNFRFQIEKEGGGAVTYQVDQTVVNMNTWTELTFDFSGFPFTDGTSGVYDKIVIFPDYIQDGPPADGSIFYIDDIEQTAGSGGGNDCPTPMDPANTTSLPVDFEDCEDLTGVFEDGDGVTGFPTSNPDMNGNPSSRVYQYNKVSGAQWYSGLWHVFPSNYDMTTTKVFKMKIWSSRPNSVVRFQIEKEEMQGPIVTYQVDQTVVNANTWTELTFDFSIWPFTSGTDVYDRITIFPDFFDDGTSEGDIFYLDDIILTN